MENSAIHEQISNIEAKIRLLLEKQHQLKEELIVLKKENNSLKEENENLKKIVNEKNLQANDFQNQSKLHSIVDYLVVEAETPTMLKDRIDEYIKEIDNCIAYLNRQI
jgi:regulator of replication initiation timing